MPTTIEVMNNEVMVANNEVSSKSRESICWQQITRVNNMSDANIYIVIVDIWYVSTYHADEESNKNTKNNTT